MSENKVVVNIEGNASSALTSIEKVITSLQNMADKVKETSDRLQTVSSSLKTAMDESKKSVVEAGVAIKGTSKEVTQLNIDTKKAASSVKELGNQSRVAFKGTQTAMKSAASSAKSLNSELGALARRQSELAASNNRLATSNNNLDSSQRRRRQSASQTQDDDGGLALGGLSLRSSRGLIGGAINAAPQLLIAGAALKASSAVLQAAESVNLLEIRIRGLTKSDAEAQESLEALRKTSATTGATLDSLAQTFQNIKLASDSYGLTNDQALALTDTLSKMGVVTGVSTEKMSAGIRQFGQSLGKGVINGDELTSILENMPYLAGVIAKSFGVSTSKLKEMGEKGELVMSKILPAILAEQEKINKQMEQMPTLISAGAAEASNGIMALLGDLNKTLEVSSLIAKTIGGIGKIAMGVRDSAFWQWHFGPESDYLQQLDAIGEASEDFEEARRNYEKKVAQYNKHVREGKTELKPDAKYELSPNDNPLMSSIKLPTYIINAWNEAIEAQQKYNRELEKGGFEPTKLIGSIAKGGGSKEKTETETPEEIQKKKDQKVVDRYAEGSDTAKAAQKAMNARASEYASHLKEMEKLGKEAAEKRRKDLADQIKMELDAEEEAEKEEQRKFEERNKLGQETLDNRARAFEAEQKIKEDIKKQKEQEIEDLRNSLKTETEIITEEHLKRAALIEEMELSKIPEIRAEAADLSKREQVRYDKELLEARRAAMTETELMMQPFLEGELGDRIQNWTALAAQAFSHSKKMFKIAKTAALANIIVSNGIGVAKELEKGWVGIPTAAVIALKGLAEYNKVKATEFGGGAAPSTSGTAAPQTNNNQGDGDTTMSTGQKIVQVSIQGSVFNAQGIRDLITAINDQSPNGSKIMFV